MNCLLVCDIFDFVKIQDILDYWYSKGINIIYPTCYTEETYKVETSWCGSSEERIQFRNKVYLEYKKLYETEQIDKIYGIYGRYEAGSTIVENLVKYIITDYFIKISKSLPYELCSIIEIRKEIRREIRTENFKKIQEKYILIRWVMNIFKVIGYIFLGIFAVLLEIACLFGGQSIFLESLFESGSSDNPKGQVEKSIDQIDLSKKN